MILESWIVPLIYFITLLESPKILIVFTFFPRHVVGCRPSQGERLFLEENHARRKRQLKGKVACVREAGETHMQGRQNDTTVRVFVMHCMVGETMI